MKLKLIIILLIIPNWIFSQWIADSFAVIHSVDFEDNTVGAYGANPLEWEADWNEDYDWFKNHNIVSIKQKGPTQVMEFVYPEGTYDGTNQGTDWYYTAMTKAL